MSVVAYPARQEGAGPTASLLLVVLPMMDIEEVHRMLDAVETVIDRLDGIKAEQVSLDEVGDLCFVLSELHDHRTAYTDTGPSLAISPSVLTRYVKFHPTYSTSEARLVARRVRSFLRSQDQATRERALPDTPPQPGPPPPETKQDPAPVLDIAAEGWRYVGPSGDLKAKILALSSLLDSIITVIEKSNQPPSEQVLTQLERNQLIVILETTLAVLKAPMVERGLLAKLRKTLGRTAAKATEHQAEQAVGSLAGLAVERITDLINSLW